MCICPLSTLRVRSFLLATLPEHHDGRAGKRPRARRPERQLSPRLRRRLGIERTVSAGCQGYAAQRLLTPLSLKLLRKKAGDGPNQRRRRVDSRMRRQLARCT